MPKKIFELAKELDMGAIDLVEDLKVKGFSVRNHMTSLSDEDVEKVIESFKASEKEAAPAKKTKKKVTKKKSTSKKKVTKKAAAKSETKKASSDEETPKKKTLTRKKGTVIRKKGKEEDAVEAAPAEVSPSSVEADEEVTTTPPAPEASTTLGEAFKTSSEEETGAEGGLRVVSRPEAKTSETSEEGSAETIPEKEESELYKEKVHKFTPVFIPEKKEEDSSAPRKEGEAASSSPTSGTTAEGDSKKRLGGLASMMSGKKGSVSRAQTLNQERADSELKSYAALSGTGRPIYTQIKRKRIYSGPSKSTLVTDVKDSKRVIKLHGGGTALEIAKKLKIKLKDFIDQCLELNLLVKGEDYIGIGLASEMAALYGYRTEDIAFNEDAVMGKSEMSEEEKEKLPLRDPIITIMGHVDHGKTTLLDYIRSAKVASGEAGGITQHIGAYSVVTGSGKKLTFLDTPGHAAFASMRQRGANITDIVILVVAADDGVMPQTKESVRFIQNAGVPLIVAINKMDKEEANPDRIKNELTEFQITPEEWGGETMMVPISALKGDGVDNLLESVALQAEVMELRAEAKGKAEGVVIESKIEAGRGPVATVLVQTGTLKKGDTVVVGETYGRARSLTDSTGKALPMAGPSIPVQILGLQDAPSPGDNLNVVKNEREAKKIVQNRVDERKSMEAVPKKSSVSLEDFFATATGEGADQKTLNLIIRSDVQGSFEAIKQALEALSNTEVDVKVMGGGVGPISDSDVQLAQTAEAIIMGFNMRPVTSARKLSDQLGIEIRTYSIIYELINEVTLALEGMLEPEYTEKYIGRAEIKETFNVPKVGVIAGSVVVDGKIEVGCKVRLLREGRILYDGGMTSLKRFKDDVKEVKSGYECGVGLENFNDLKVGDLYECYIMEERKRTLEDVRSEEAAKERARIKEAEAAAAAAAESEAMTEGQELNP